MNTRLWVLNPLLLATTLPVFSTQAAEENLIVSANRTHRTVAEMAQTTWVIEGHEIEQQVQGARSSKMCWRSLFQASTSAARDGQTTA
nr:putative TonB-dependent receptor [Raoultella sp. NCTC 9187]